MTNAEERLFMLDLAIVQLIAGILVTLGSTLFAISIGFGLTIPNTMQEILVQIFTMNTEISPEIQQELVHESLSNYVLILAFFSILLIIAGVVFASAKARKLKGQINSARAAQNLISTDLKEGESATSNARTTESEA